MDHARKRSYRAKVREVEPTAGGIRYKIPDPFTQGWASGS